MYNIKEIIKIAEYVRVESNSSPKKRTIKIIEEYLKISKIKK